MSRASNRRRPRWPWWRLGRAGVTSVEFGVVALLFLLVLIGCMDLGRYYLIEHSLRTIVAEAARAALVNSSINGQYNGPIDSGSIANTVMTPLVNNANLTLTVMQPSGFPGINQLSVSATYTFTAYSPIWDSLNGTISESTELQY